MRTFRIRRHGADRAAITPFAVIVSSALFLMAGLVHDGGVILAERREVGSAASAAARVAAREIDEGAVRDNRVTIAPDRAAHAVAAYLDRVGVGGAIVGLDGAVVTVEATSVAELRFLGIVGMHARKVSARATARVARGVVEADR